MDLVRERGGMINPALLGAVAAGVGGGSGQFNGLTGWTDFSEQDDWANPAADWTERFAAINTNTTHRLQRLEIIHGRSIGGKMLLIDNHMDGFNGDYRGIVTWDIPGSLPAADIEILVLMRAWTNNQHGLGISDDDAPDGGTGLYTPPLMQGMSYTAWNSNPRLRDFRKSAGSNSWGANTFTDAGAGAAITSNKRYFLRFRRTATKRWRAKIWDADLSEPGAWQHDANPDALFEDASGGFIGIMLANWVGSASDPILVEYVSVSTNPDTTPAPMPASLVLTGGHFGAVDMTTAAVDAAGFVMRRLTTNVPVATMEARPGSKHGTVLKIAGSAAGNSGGVVTWEPGRNLFNGDVLALMEIAASGPVTTEMGAGVMFPRVPNGSGIYDLGHKSFATLRDSANAVAWMGSKETSTQAGWSLFVNVAGVTIGAGDRWWVRHRRTMHQIQCRFWKEGDAEPSTWQVDSTGQRQRDVVGTPAFGVAFSAANGTCYLEHLAWTDDPTENPVNPI